MRKAVLAVCGNLEALRECRLAFGEAMWSALFNGGRTELDVEDFFMVRQEGGLPRQSANGLLHSWTLRSSARRKVPRSSRCVAARATFGCSDQFFFFFFFLPLGQTNNLMLLAGEAVLSRESEVELMQSGNRQLGSLFLTTYRLVFVPAKRGSRVYSVPLGCIAQLDVSYNVLRVLCKYFRLLEFCWTLWPGSAGAPDLSVSAYMWGAASVTSSTAVVVSPVQGFRQAVCDQMATPFCLVSAFHATSSPRQQQHQQHLGVQLYSGIGQEMRRLGVPTNEWRISTANEHYTLCSTYPRTLCVPAGVTDEQLRVVASFRSSARIPALCWYSSVTGAALLRCAQPLAGLLRASCAEDQALVECARRNASVVFLVDARPKMSAYANQAKGAGTENPANYPNSRLVFLGIENIHTVRVAHKALFDLVMGQCLSGESSTGWYAGIEKTGWMDHVHSVVRGAAKVAEMMSIGKSSVVLHCR